MNNYNNNSNNYNNNNNNNYCYNNNKSNNSVNYKKRKPIKLKYNLTKINNKISINKIINKDLNYIINSNKLIRITIPIEIIYLKLSPGRRNHISVKLFVHNQLHQNQNRISSLHL